MRAETRLCEVNCRRWQIQNLKPFDPEAEWRIQRLASNLNVKMISSGDSRVSEVGEKSSSANREILISFTDPKGEERHSRLQSKWMWSGSILRGVDEAHYTVELTLRVDVEGKEPVFRFHPRRLSDVTDRARADMIEFLAEAVRCFPVYEGRLEAW